MAQIWQLLPWSQVFLPLCSITIIIWQLIMIFMMIIIGSFQVGHRFVCHYAQLQSHFIEIPIFKTAWSTITNVLIQISKSVSFHSFSCS